MLRQWILATASFAILGAPLAAASDEAADYPSKPVTIVVPYSAGGGNDIIARIVAQALEERFGQRFLVENRPGAGSAVGTAYVAAQPADGYTILFSTSQLISTNLTLKEPNYSIDDFVPLGMVSSTAEVLAVSSSLGVDSVESFIAYGKEHPGELTYASTGTASNDQVIAAIFSEETGVDMVEVPYPGGNDALQALASGEIQVYFGANVQAVESGIEGIDFLAISGEERSSFLPDMPTFIELGYPRFISSAWSAMFVPAATPPAIVEKLRTAIFEIANAPATAEALAGMQRDVYPGTAEDFEKLIAGKIDEITAHIEKFQIQPE